MVSGVWPSPATADLPAAIRCRVVKSGLGTQHDWAKPRSDSADAKGLGFMV